MTNRTMGDSTIFGSVPDTFQIIGAYIDGHFGVVTAAQMEARYPKSKFGQCLFDVNGKRPDANARDWEPGNYAGSLEQWVIDHNKASGKKDAIIYSDRSDIPDIRKRTGSQVLAKDYFLLPSTLDGTLVTGEGVIGCQNKGTSLTHGSWDSGVIYDDRFFRSTGTPGTPTGPPVLIKWAADCKSFQKAVRTPADGKWGPNTDRNAATLIAAGQLSFPNTVGFAQQVVGTRVDSVWGPNSKQAQRDTVAQAQRALIGMGATIGTVDGVWGPLTNAGYLAARAHFHI